MTKHSTQAAADRISRSKRPTTGEHIRKRTQVACERCRKRKIKCSLSGSETGCETCNNAGEKCVVNRVGSKEYTFELTPSDGDVQPTARDQSFGGHHTLAGYVDSRHYPYGLMTPSASSRQGSVNSMASTAHSSPYRLSIPDQYGYGPLPGPLAGPLPERPIINPSHRTPNGYFGATMPHTGCNPGSFASHNGTFHANNPMYSTDSMPGARFMARSGHASMPSSGGHVRSGQQCPTGNTNDDLGVNAAHARMATGFSSLATPPRTQPYSRAPYTAQTSPTSNSIATSPAALPNSEASFSPASTTHSHDSPTTSAMGSFTAGLDEQRMNTAPYATMASGSMQASAHPDPAAYASVYARRPSHRFAPYGLTASTSALAHANQMSAIQNSNLGYSPTTASYQYQPYYAPPGSRGPPHGRLGSIMEYKPYNYYGPGAQQSRSVHRHHHHHQDLDDDDDDRQHQTREYAPGESTNQWSQRNNDVELAPGVDMRTDRKAVQ